MVNNHNPDTILIRLDKGKNIVKNLTKFCTQNNIYGAWINGLGAVDKATLMLYDVKSKKYHKKSVSGPYELVNLQGNIGTFEGKVVAHLHVLLSDKNMKCIAGHLDEARVSATCEIKIDVLDVNLCRKYDKDTGLNLINLE